MKKRERISFISEIKGMAMLMIMFCHFTRYFFDVSPNYLFKYSIYGEMGCQIFFTLSGFCLCFSNSNQNIISYLKKRYIAIAPGYYVMILLSISLCIISTAALGMNIFETRLDIPNVLLNFSLLHGIICDNHTVRGGWYVGTIVLMYLLFPFIKSGYFRLNAKIRFLVFPLVGILICSFILFAISHFFPTLFENKQSAFYRSIVNQIPCFLIGISAYDLYVKGNTAPINLFVSVILIIFSFYCYFNVPHSNYILVPSLVGYATFFLLLGYGALKHKSRFRVLSIIGDNSFGIYLTHMFVVCEFVSIINRVLLWGNVNDIYLRYLVSLLVSFPLAVYCGKIYQRYTSYNFLSTKSSLVSSQSLCKGNDNKIK